MPGLTRDRARRAVCLLAFAALLCSGPGWASTRVALVVGNGGYAAANIPALPNPVNDARLMAGALKTSGFEVRLVTDADQGAMRAAIEAFGEALERAGADAVGLFYYAGHGVEVRGQNYLIPIGAEIAREVEFKTDAVPVDWVLSWMEVAGNRLNMVVLDACRNNPYEGRYRGASQGLAQMDAPSGSLIAYSAAPGQVAVDGEGENSPYTAALAGALAEPGLKVEDVFKRVRVAVEDATNGQQTPWESSSLRGDFYFVAEAEAPQAPEPATVTVVETVSPELTVQQLAARAYEAAERLHTVASYQLVIEQFPDTLYAQLAEQHIEKLESDTVMRAASTEETEAALGLERAERARLQFRLRALGFSPGPPDGVFGRRTREAIAQWQASQGGSASGYLNRTQAEEILTKTSLAPMLRPKCAELPGQYLGENHAECWAEIENRPGCFLWRPHYHSDQTIRWTGGCTGGVAEGHGQYSVSPGSNHASYEGAGTLINSKASGHWTGEWADGTRYEGEYRDGKRHGRGTYTWPDGDRYEGQWRDGKRHGRGTLTWKGTGEYAGREGRYEGQWRNSKRHGRGSQTWPVGHRYEGQWRDGKPHGHGTLTVASGDRYEGQWRKGCFDEDGRRAWVYTTKEACGFE